jgi:protein phosphatase 1 regulatory subunit 37
VPIPLIVEHLEAINLDKTSSSTARTEVLNLRHQQLTHESCEALEELFKNVKYKTIDLTACSLDDVSATAIFDMIEYYEACNELIIAENSNIKNLGWQSCEFALVRLFFFFFLTLLKFASMSSSI